jgi:hypothetical protein
MDKLLTFIETPAFLSDADFAGMTEEDCSAAVDHVSRNPEDRTWRRIVQGPRRSSRSQQ